MNSPVNGALSGVRIIDLTRVLSGPYCTQILGDHGADVIKIEPPQGDETRGWGPPFKNETASYFTGINRNKRSVVIDLASAQGREALLGLLETADVLVENFKTGTMEKWGLGYADLLEKRFPRLVYSRISGFGADGPLGGMPGYDAAIQAMSGLMSVNGEPDGDPVRLGVPIVDLAAGLNATIGILMALREREKNGRGQFVETTLFDCAISVLHPQLANFFMTKQLPKRTGNAHPNIAPYDAFATATDPLFLAVGNNRQFGILCSILGCASLFEDPRFTSNALRSQNRNALKRELEAHFAEHKCQEIADRLIKAGVPCGPVLNLDRVVDHPHTQHRQIVIEIDDYVGVGSPIRLSRTRASYRRRPPRLGEHTSEILPSNP